MDSEILQRQAFKPGDIIFKDGEEGRMAYIIQAGEVEIIKQIDDKENILGTIGEGGIFGEMALIDMKPRMASARAVQATTVICINQQMFEDKMRTTNRLRFMMESSWKEALSLLRES